MEYQNCWDSQNKGTPETLSCTCSKDEIKFAEDRMQNICGKSNAGQLPVCLPLLPNSLACHDTCIQKMIHFEYVEELIIFIGEDAQIIRYWQLFGYLLNLPQGVLKKSLFIQILVQDLDLIVPRSNK